MISLAAPLDNPAHYHEDLLKLEGVRNIDVTGNTIEISCTRNATPNLSASLWKRAMISWVSPGRNMAWMRFITDILKAA